MAGITSLLNNGQGSSGFGLQGFLNGQSIGKDTQDSNGGLMQAAGRSLSQRLGLNLASANNNPASLLNRLQNSSKTSNLQELEKQRLEDEKKKDRLETTSDERNSLNQAATSALKNGTTQQILVSEDGRFEASIDMRINADGSYSLDLSVQFANAKAAMMSQTQSTGEETNQENPASQSYQGASAAYQRYTSYEQILQARGFEASIFFEEAKSVAAVAEQAYGTEMGNQYMAVAGEVSHEYTLNISISGDDLSNFNEVAEQLMQYDDSGTLGGFLEAAKNVLSADSSDIGAFVGATQSLLGATQNHVSSKLNNFFTSMQDQFGGTLEELGFESNFLENLGQDVESDLKTFFQVTNDLFSSLVDKEEIENYDAKTEQLEAFTEKMDEYLEEQLQEEQEVNEEAPVQEESIAEEQEEVQVSETLEELIQEMRQSLVGEPLPPRPQYGPLFQNELPPRPEHRLEAVA